MLEAESPGIADKMRELQKAGKVVIAIDSDGQADARRAYIGTNNRKAGEAAGKAAAAIRPEGGKIAVFVGTAAAANAIERREGFFAGRRAQLFTQVEVFEDGGDKSRRPRQRPDRHHASTPTWASCSASGRTTPSGSPRRSASRPSCARRRTSSRSTSTSWPSASSRRGTIDATVCQNPYEMGYQGVRLLKALIEKDDKTVERDAPRRHDTIDTGVRVIVPSKDSPVKGDNVIDIKEMKEWLASKGLKSS